MVGKVTPNDLLSASQLAAVMGFSPWSTANDVLSRVVAAHRGDIGNVTIANEGAAWWGNIHEPAILGVAAEVLGVTDKLLLEHPKPHFAPFGTPLACSLDASVAGPLLLDIEDRDAVYARVRVMTDTGRLTLKGRGVLEAKCDMGYALDEPKAHKGPLQLQAQMLCTGAMWGAVCTLFRGAELVIYVYERDKAVIDTICQVAIDFQRRVEAVLAGGSGWYPPQTASDAAKLFPGDDSETACMLPPEAAAIISDYNDAKRTIEIAEGIVDQTSAALMEMLGNHVSGSVRDEDGRVWHVKWPTKTYKGQPAKTVPAKPGYTVRQKSISVKEARS
jgi:hypothetical protein